jgi:hypothetical protein
LGAFGTQPALVRGKQGPVDKQEGYIVIALDDRRYVDLAVNLALSIRRCETRPVSLVTSPGTTLSPGERDLFDAVITAPPEGTLKGAMNKARLYDLTPYDRTMYLDSDCLLFSPRIEFFWHTYRGHPVAVEGHRQAQGPVFACSLGTKDAATLCTLMNVPYLTVFNAGVIYFERTDAARRVFDKVKELHAGPHRDAISYRYKHEGEYADEPFFGVALATLGIPPLEPPVTARLQVTTPNVVDGVLDLDTGDLRLIKQPTGSAPQLWSGVLCHFCGLAPMITYFNLADRLRTEASLPLMDRSLFKPVLLTAAHHVEAPP